MHSSCARVGMQKKITPKRSLWLALAMLGAAFLAADCGAEDRQPVVFFKAGTSTPVDFAALQPRLSFDVVNVTGTHLLLVFEPNASAKISPSILRLAPGARQTVQISATSTIKSFELRYAVSLSA